MLSLSSRYTKCRLASSFFSPSPSAASKSHINARRNINCTTTCTLYHSIRVHTNTHTSEWVNKHTTDAAERESEKGRCRWMDKKLGVWFTFLPSFNWSILLLHVYCVHPVQKYGQCSLTTAYHASCCCCFCCYFFIHCRYFLSSFSPVTGCASSSSPPLPLWYFSSPLLFTWCIFTAN